MSTSPLSGGGSDDGRALPPPACVICGLALALTTPRQWLCEPHRLEREARQRDGMPADALDPRWHDNLTTWRDRPEALRAEPDADRLQFVHRFGPWLLFMRGYSNRLPDWLAVNVESGEARRFVEVELGDVEDLLEDPSLLPDVAGRLSHWGNPESAMPPWDALARTYLDAQNRTQLARLITDASEPVYGPHAHRAALRLISLSYSNGASGVSGVKLLFGDWTLDGSTTLLAVRTQPIRRTRHARLPIPPELMMLGYNPYHDGYIDLQANGEGAPRPYPAGMPEAQEREVWIAGARFAGRIDAWPGASVFAGFELVGDSHHLEGVAIGLSVEQLVELLEGMVVLREHPELIAAYQAEMNERTAKLWDGSTPARSRADDPSVRGRVPLLPGGEHGQGRTVQAVFAVRSDAAGGPGEEPAPLPPVPGALRVRNESDQYALLLDDAWMFDGRFTVIVPPGYRPRAVEAIGVTAGPVDGQPNALGCAMGTDDAVLRFTAEPV